MKIVKRLFYICLILICFVIGSLFYAIKIEPYYTITKTFSIEYGETEQISIVQVSDIQISEYYTVNELKKLVKKINQLEPDLFIFTGDLYENYSVYGPEQEVIEELKRIEAVYGKYAIYGNRDYGGGAVRRYEDIMESSGFKVLKNTGEYIELKGGKTVFLGGLDDYLMGNQNIEEIVKDMEKQESNYKILLTHEPDVADFYKDYDFNLILAGHSHGGQVHIPFMEGISTSMAKKYRKGFYVIEEENNLQLYVNSGIGTSRYPIRFLVPPEITRFYIKI